jgi:glycosyltransferase involved in cell wall biosynthesis
MNRLCHLEHTLPQNIEDNEDCEDLEFVVLDYNSTDGLEEWIRDSYIDLIKEGRLVYFHEKSATHFLPSHSRNISIRCATGEVTCNVDADNFTGEGFASFLTEVFQPYRPILANSYDLSSWHNMSTHGRLAMHKQSFLRMGGYDEFMRGWGAEDFDLNNRCLLAGFERVEIPEKYFKVIDHGDDVRVENCDFGFLDAVPESEEERKEATNKINCDRMAWKRRNRFYVANVGKCWGEAFVEKNFVETIHLGNPWIALS